MPIKLLDPAKLNYNPSKLFTTPPALLTVHSNKTKADTTNPICSSDFSQEKSLVSSLNTMTIGWGQFGFAWGKNIMTVMVRPSRYSYKILENSDTFSVSFFDDSFKDKIIFCGRNSGKDVNKFTECNFNLDYYENTPYIKEAKLTAICKKLYTHEMDLNGFQNDYKDLAQKFYGEDGTAQGGLHKIYTAEILALFEEE